MKPLPKLPRFGIPVLSEDVDSSVRPSRRRDVTWMPLPPPDEKGPSEDDRDPPSVG